MDQDDLGAVDEAEEPEEDGSDEESRAGRQSRPQIKSTDAGSVELSQTFQAEVSARSSRPAPERRATTKGRSVELSRTFQAEVEERLSAPPKPKIPPRIAARPIPARPIPPPKRPPPPPGEGKELARAERLAKRLRDRKSSQKIPVARPAKKPLPSHKATLDGLPFTAVLTPPTPRPSPVEPIPGRETVEGPIPSMEELESAAADEGISTIRPEPAEEERPSDGGTTPSVESPVERALEPTPTSTPRSPPRPSSPTLMQEEARAPDAPPTESPPAFQSEMIESDVKELDSLEIDLSATYRSEIGFHEGGEEESEDGPELVIERRGPTDNEARVATDDDDPFGDLYTGAELGGRYRLERIIGRGATGVVFEASHLIIGKRVAVKCLYPHYLETPNAVERFFREAKIAATVEHPNVVQVFDGGRETDTMFLAMELLSGETLGDRLERGPMPTDEALDMFLKVADGVAAVHERGVVHRDLKPDNVFLPEPQGGRPVEPKVLDFGVSKLKEPGNKELTSLGTVLGTPYYMSPEQIRNTRDVDATADVYSLGVILYEMLTGELPYDGDSVVDIFEAARDGDYVPLEERTPNIPAGLSQIVHQALRPERKERFENARALHAAVEAVALAGTDPDRDPPTDPRRDPKKTIEEHGPSPLLAQRPDSVPERDLAQLAEASDSVLRRGRELATVELEREDPKAIAAETTDHLSRPQPNKRRLWIWVIAVFLTLAVSGVIGAAVIELMR